MPDLEKAVEALIAASEVAYMSEPDDPLRDLDDEDVCGPGIGITFGMIRRARAEFERTRRPRYDCTCPFDGCAPCPGCVAASEAALPHLSAGVTVEEEIARAITESLWMGIGAGGGCDETIAEMGFAICQQQGEDAARTVHALLSRGGGAAERSGSLVEQVCREVCRIEGVDPDELQQEWESGAGALRPTDPRWTRYATDELCAILTRALPLPPAPEPADTQPFGPGARAGWGMAGHDEPDPSSTKAPEPDAAGLRTPNVVALVDGVLDLFPGTDRQALNCLAELMEKDARTRLRTEMEARQAAERERDQSVERWWSMFDHNKALAAHAETLTASLATAEAKYDRLFTDNEMWPGSANHEIREVENRHGIKVVSAEHHAEMVTKTEARVAELEAGVERLKGEHADEIEFLNINLAERHEACEAAEARLAEAVVALTIAQSELRRNLQRERDEQQRAWLQSAFDAVEIALRSRPDTSASPQTDREKVLEGGVYGIGFERFGGGFQHIKIGKHKFSADQVRRALANAGEARSSDA